MVPHSGNGSRLSDGKTPSCHMRHQRHHPASGPPDCSPAPCSPSPDSSAEPSGPRAMVAGQSTHAAQAWASGPLRPARPQASSLAGRRVEGSGSRQPGVCARAYISRQLFLPQAMRKPGGPGLPLPRLVKPAQQHPRPGCHQRLPPATGAQRCPNSLPGARLRELVPWWDLRQLCDMGTIPTSGGQQAGQRYLSAHIHCSYPPPQIILLKQPSDGSQIQIRSSSEC